MYNCLGEDTVIDTIKGKILIRDLINKTPILYSYDRLKEKFITQKAEKIWCEGIRYVYEIVFECGISLEATIEHKILTIDRLYKKVISLEINDKIKSIYEWLNEDKVTGIFEIGEKEVYNIDMGRNIGNFIANGFVVHP